MNVLIGKTPFLRLLIPLIAGIVVGEFFPKVLSFYFQIALVGIFFLLFSFFIRPNDQYRFRWLFGAGIFIFIFPLSFYQIRQNNEFTRITVPSHGQYDLGIVLNIPEIKPRSIAVNIKTAPPHKKKAILYLEKTNEARELKPGDEIVFVSKIKPFRNFGNPDDFDYVRYMKNKGFAGSSYISADDWKKTGREMKSISIMAQRFRAKALDFYRSFDMDNDAYGFICALTLGYKVNLSNDLQEAFRASGTAHVLALSGLHVGIIYAVVSFLFSFLGKSGLRFIIQQWLAICTLWTFVFIVGMSASIVRAAIMLTLFTLGNLYHRRGITYNSLAASAFLILIFQPSYLFDVSFQMSFASVFAILFFYPKITQLYHPSNKVAKYAWGLFSITTSAQLGVFPLVLYHFGTFPTWFFITNMLVVPFIGIIIYATFPLIIFGLLRPLQGDIFSTIYSFFLWIEKTLIEVLLKIVYISESLPFAQISEKKISFVQLMFLFMFIHSITWMIVSRRPRSLIITLSTLLLLQFSTTYKYLTTTAPQLMIFNNPGQREIAVYHNNKRQYLDIPENGFIPHPQKSILLMSETDFNACRTEKPFHLDILILSQQSASHIEKLLGIFSPEMVILDSSVPRYMVSRISRVCSSSNINLYDVTENGAFSINF